MAAIAQACELEPMKPQYLRAAGRIFGQAGVTSKAISYYEQALNWGGDDSEIEHEIKRLRSGKRARGKAE
jgi:hypothetical protein